MTIDPTTKALLLIIGSYLVGSIPFGYIIAHLWAGVDIREHGSGNPGATNVWRVLGAGPGSLTFLLDFSKGLLPMKWALWVMPLSDFGNNGFLWAIVLCLAGFAAMVGHAYPVWFLFRGGKIVATGLGVMAALIGPWVLIPILLFGMTFALTRFVSLASMVAAASVPIIFILGLWPQYEVFPKSNAAGNWVFLAFAFVSVLLVMVRHKSNIERLKSGKELKVGGGTPPPAPPAPRSLTMDAGAGRG